ncbi:MAG TPA: TetR/AcrR family transcriptional regulator [Roseiflexaceae bacterium]|nr:TetR/AcrR family transcriptional regulator [Roseiflexaceae bacterium]
MSSDTYSTARERVLGVAERIFSERGYRAVTLREIADELGMKQASLYNHAPGGKEQLFVEVTERSLRRHGEHLRQAIAAAEPNLRAQLRAAARWLLSQPPLNLDRMSTSDMPSIEPEVAQKLARLSADALFIPIDEIIAQAYRRGETRLTVPMMFAAMFLTIIESLHHAQQYSRIAPEVMADDVIDILLDGILRR